MKNERANYIFLPRIFENRPTNMQTLTSHTPNTTEMINMVNIPYCGVVAKQWFCEDADPFHPVLKKEMAYEKDCAVRCADACRMLPGLG